MIAAQYYYQIYRYYTRRLYSRIDLRSFHV